MRIHMDDQPVSQFVVVTLDGELLEHVVWADDVEGVAEVEVFDEDGPVKEEGRPLIDRLEGEVAISLADDAPDWAVRLYKQFKIDQAAKAELEAEKKAQAEQAAAGSGRQADQSEDSAD